MPASRRDSGMGGIKLKKYRTFIARYIPEMAMNRIPLALKNFSPAKCLRIFKNPQSRPRLVNPLNKKINGPIRWIRTGTI